MSAKTLCVYCGSSDGSHPRFLNAATQLGTVLAENNINLVYGGASIGLMGAVADAVLTGGGKVTGVIPEALYQKEVAHQGLSELHVVADMHERKSLMACLSDGFITLPGGLGTLEELFEVLTWSQLNLHNKPIGLLNTGGYFDSLVDFIDQAIDQGFVKPENKGLLTIHELPHKLVMAMTPAQQ